jgi:hypothetical protein
MKGFKDLKVWHKAHELTLAVYGTTRRFPREELYGLTSQLRRSAASIAANIAEGCDDARTVKWLVFFRSREDRRARWSTTSCWLTTFTFWKKTSTDTCRSNLMKCKECSQR